MNVLKLGNEEQPFCLYVANKIPSSVMVKTTVKHIPLKLFRFPNEFPPDDVLVQCKIPPHISSR